MKQNTEYKTEEKTEIPGLYKVDESLVINKDDIGLKNYKKIKARSARVDRVQEELKTLKNDINEIKEILRGLVK